MKAKRRRLIGLGLIALGVGASVFLLMPDIADKTDFVLGLIAGLVLVTIAFVLVLTGSKRIRQIGLSIKGQKGDEAQIASGTNDKSWILVSAFIVMIGLVGGFFVFKQDELVKAQAQHQRALITQQAELIQSIRIRSMVFLMNNVLDKVDDELRNGEKQMLSDETISRIADLSYSFKPYTSFEGDSMSSRKLSPERGQLLLALSRIGMDPGSLKQIMFRTSFSAADLRDSDLRDANLKGIDMKEADLESANLKGANLYQADLGAAHMWGINLRNADISEANLKRADLRWADLSGADLKDAILNGANLTSTVLRKADLTGAFLQWADLSGAFLNEANLTGANFAGSILKRTNLSDANLIDANLASTNMNEANLTRAKLIGTNLRYTNLTEVDLSGADMTGVYLTGAIISERDWFGKLASWNVVGVEEMTRQFKIVEEDFDGGSQYRVQKIEN